MRWRLGPIPVVLLATACSGGGGDAEPVVTTASSVSSATAAVPAVLDVVAPAVGGGEIDLAAYAGRDVALWFWAPT